jgi:hypothetical protein
MLRRLLFALAIAVPIGCSEGGGASADLAGGDLAHSGDLAVSGDLAKSGGDLAQAGSSCGVPSDCRLYSNNCDTCACEALRTDEVDPVCNGNPVSCFVDPCDGKSGDCQGGHCIVK